MTKAGVGGRQKAAPSLLGSIFPEAELSSHEEPIIRMDSGADRPAGAVEAALGPTHNLLQVALISCLCLYLCVFSIKLIQYQRWRADSPFLTNLLLTYITWCKKDGMGLK